ncbi:MAG: serine/threonine-protein kinase [Planctomycetota bacterium]
MDERDQLLAECYEEYHRRRARHERVSPEDFRDRLGSHHAAFIELLSGDTVIDRVLGTVPAESLPRTFGDYTLLRVLGRGRHGVVYEAVQRSLGRTVALKVLRMGIDTAPETYLRFQREAKACAQVRHENIVEIYEASQVDQQPFYAMSLVRGRTLGDLVRSGEAPEPADLCRGLAGIADALHALHAEGIIHRDVKPSNVVVTPEGRMVLADFGLARSALAETLTLDGQVVGTPLYMSPEQIVGKRHQVDLRSDIYGLGATLYEALAGRTPYQAHDLTDLVRTVIREHPATLRSVAPHVPRDCARIAMKAIEFQPRDRYPTADQLRDDLLAYAEGRPVVGRPVSPVRRTLRRYRGLLAAAAALLLISAGVLIWWSGRPADVRFLSSPCAEVYIDGELVGTTPCSARVPAGEHRITFRLPGSHGGEQRVTLEPGERRTIQCALVAVHAEEAEAPDRPPHPRGA